MKTLVLATVSAAALLAAGGAFAQTGAANVESEFASARGTALAAKAPSNAASMSYANQYGDHNTADVSQVGGSASSRQLSVVLQGWSGSKSNNSSATVSQSAGNEQSVVMQRDTEVGGLNIYGPTNPNNSATVTQSGSGENSFAYQSGHTNTINITESGTGSAPSSQVYTTSVNNRDQAKNGVDFARSFEGVDKAYGYLGKESTEVVQIDARDNTAKVTQGADTSAAHIVQWLAENNKATIGQDAGGYNNKALTYQTGYDSEATITQDSISHGSAASIFQVSGDQDGYGTGNNSHDNHATITQHFSFDNTAIALQAGTNNYATIDQSSVASKAYSHQNGSGNESNITQTVAGYQDLAVTDQTGSGNKATVTQDRAYDTSYVSQNGTAGGYGYATNTATVHQYANNDSSILFQDGQKNTATVNQSGTNDFSYLNQIGSGSAMNTATINQYANNVASIGYQNGGGNTLTVTQGMAPKMGGKS